MRSLRRWLLAGLLTALAVPAADQDITTGLIGDWKLNETSGTMAADSSPAGNDGTYLSGVSLATSAPLPGGGAVGAVFDGVNDYVAVGNEWEFDATGPITVSAWIKVDAFTKPWQAILTKGNTAWRLSRNANSNTVYFGCSGLNPGKVTGTTDVNDGRWHHLVGVYDGSSLTLYVDGVVEKSVGSTGSISTNNYEVEIGRNCADQRARVRWRDLRCAGLRSRAFPGGRPGAICQEQF